MIDCQRIKGRFYALGGLPLSPQWCIGTSNVSTGKFKVTNIKRNRKVEKTVSKENVAKLNQRLMSNPSLLKKIEDDWTDEALVRLAEAEGLPFTAEELDAYLNEAIKKGKLSDEDLIQVSGGLILYREDKAYLMVTPLYGCEHWLRIRGHFGEKEEAKTCNCCTYRQNVGLTMICTCPAVMANPNHISEKKLPTK
jgi:predicted ribosomally synthesized peptide with nif11-like leader